MVIKAEEFHETILKIEHGTHSGPVLGLLVSSDGKLFITSGADKTIRIWKLNPLREGGKILGEIGDGASGRIQAMDLSPDNRYLAVAVHTGTTHNKGGVDETTNIVRLYDFKTREIIKVLHPAFQDNVTSLAFSNDGKYLLVGSEENTLKIWEVAPLVISKLFDPTPQYVIRDSNYIRRPYAVAMIRKDKDYHIISADYSENCREISLFSLEKETFLNHYAASNRLTLLKVSELHIATTGYDPQVLIFDHNLELKKTIDLEKRAYDLAFSPSGRFLLAGGRVFDAQSDFEEINSLDSLGEVIQASGFVNANTAVSVVQKGNEIISWDPQKKQDKILDRLAGYGNTIFALGISGNKIGIGYTQDYKEDQNNYAPLEKVFDLDTFTVSTLQPAEAKNFVRATTTWENPDKSIQELYVDPNFGFGLIIKGEDLNLVKRDGWYYHETFGFDEEGTILTGGRGGELIAYDRRGNRLARFLGHDARVWDLAIQGDLLISGGEGQIIRIWNLGDLKAGKETIIPILNLFIASDNEWIIWTDDGFYDASLNGDKLIGYHVNQGEGQAAIFYPVDRFIKTHYRPSLITNLLNTLKGKSVKLETPSAVELQPILPPVLRLTGETERYTESRQFRLEFDVQASHDPVSRVWIVWNEHVVWDKRGEEVREGGVFSEELSLVSGENSFRVYAETLLAKSIPLLLTVHADGKSWGKAGSVVSIKPESIVPNLYLLSIGVSEYQFGGQGIDDLSYADRDAEELSKKFLTQQGGIYGEVIHKTLLNGEATTANILEATQWLVQQIKDRIAHKKEYNLESNDLIFVFLSGHGCKSKDNEGDFLFCSHDLDPEKPDLTGMKMATLGDHFSSLPADLIIFTDACRAGLMNLDLMASTEVQKRMQAISESSMAILSATTAATPSFEHHGLEHGVFTKMVLQGLEKDTRVSLMNLCSYVMLNVKEISMKLFKKKQIPIFSSPKTQEFYLFQKNE